MKTLPFLFSLFLLLLCGAVYASASAASSAAPGAAAPASGVLPRFAVAEEATPVLNTPAFSQVFRAGRRLDPCRKARPVEFVALQGTLFRIEDEVRDGGARIYRVTSNDYPYPSRTGYFVDARSLRTVETPVERIRALPGLAEVQRRLLAALGKPYVWGGNLKDGVPLLKRLYPQGDPLAGVDCSGLLYQATDGFTPRNTSALVHFGEAVPVAGKSPEEIERELKPLDLITWNGHVLIVLDGDSIIQSRIGCQGGGGVVLSPIGESLRRLVRTRKPYDEFPQGEAGKRAFVVRRWFSR